MGIGAGLALLTIGAILTFAVDAEIINNVDTPTVGLILMLVGAFGLVWGTIVTLRSRSGNVSHRGAHHHDHV